MLNFLLLFSFEMSKRNVSERRFSVCYHNSNFKGVCLFVIEITIAFSYFYVCYFRSLCRRLCMSHSQHPFVTCRWRFQLGTNVCVYIRHLWTGPKHCSTLAFPGHFHANKHTRSDSNTHRNALRCDQSRSKLDPNKTETNGSHTVHAEHRMF